MPRDGRNLWHRAPGQSEAHNNRAAKVVEVQVLVALQRLVDLSRDGAKPDRLQRDLGLCTGTARAGAAVRGDHLEGARRGVFGSCAGETGGVDAGCRECAADDDRSIRRAVFGALVRGLLRSRRRCPFVSQWAKIGISAHATILIVSGWFTITFFGV